MAARKIVSADDHMDMTAMPPDLWAARLPAEWRDRAPRVRETEEGAFWEVDGERLGRSGSMAGRVPSAITRAGIEDDGFRASTPHLRLQDMDLDGVHAQVIYGPPFGFRLSEAGFKTACLRAYNDWGAEFNGYDSNRLCLLAYLPTESPEAAAAELERVASIGHRGAVVSYFDASSRVCDPEWDHLWAAAEEVGLPLSFHLGGGMHSSKPVVGGWEFAAFAAAVPLQLDEALALMTFSGALERHPQMKLILGESGLGWIPYMLERMDLEFGKHTPSAKDYRIEMKPSEIFARQVYATFEEDRFGVRIIPEIGEDNVMWASDYPHPDSTFPRSAEEIREAFEGYDEAVIERVTYTTAAELYGLRDAAA